jgi:hypothetical protein
VEEDLSYDVESRVPALSFNDLRNARVGVLEDIYVRLPTELSPQVEALRDGWIAEARTDYEKLVAIQNNLVSPNFTYSTEPATDAATGDSVDYLEQFLLDTRTGYCQQYASAFATLSRSLGYPTRVVVGFLPGAATEGGFVVRGTDAHAWPEVFFEEFGWVAFEPTPRSGDDGAAAVTPAYTSAALSGGGPTTDPGRVTDPTGEVELPRDPDGNRPTPGAATNTDPRGGPAEPEWQRTFARLVGWLAVLTVMFLAAVPALKSWRIRRLYARAKTTRARASAAFEEFLIEAAELASPRAPAETAPAYARRLTRTRPLPKDSAAQLAAIYDACQYAPAEPSEQIAAGARALAADLRSHLWLNASLWQKAMRLFAPRFGGRGRPAGAFTGLFR